MGEQVQAQPDIGGVGRSHVKIDGQRYQLLRGAARIVVGRGGWLRLPQEFRFEGSEVYIWRDERSGTVVLSQQRPVTWDDFLQLRAELAARYAVLVGKSRERAAKHHGVPPV